MNKSDSKIHEKTELEQKVDGMKKCIDSLETNLEMYGSKTDNLSFEIEKMTQENQDLKAEIGRQNHQIMNWKNQAVKTAKNIAILKTKYEFNTPASDLLRMINAFKLRDSKEVVKESENETITANFKKVSVEKTPNEIVQESENEKNIQSLDEKLMFEKTIIHEKWYSNSKEPCSYDSEEFQKFHIKFN